MTRLTRRTLLGATLGTALLAGCTGEPGGTPATGPTAGPVLPRHLRQDGAPAPDLPGDTNGVADGYLAYPQDHPRSVPQPPGSGESVSAMTMTYGPLPPAREQNKYWQSIEASLGITLDITLTPSTDYQEKLSAVVASGQVPDIVQIQKFPKLPQLLEAKFADLTEHLSGDAIKDYPNLANLPSQVWRTSIFNNRIYGIPNPRMLVSNYVFARKDLLAAKGLSLTPADGAEFLETCRALTDHKKQQYATGDGGSAATLLAVSQMFGAPNEWREEGGKLTHLYESEEYARTIEVVKGMWRDGVMHPNTFSAATDRLWFYAGATAIWATGSGQWNAGVRDHPDIPVDLMVLPQWDGGGVAPWKLGTGSFSNAFIAAGDPDRVRLMLRICNWLAAPFGTAEYHLRSYGVEGVTHTVNAQGEPQLTESGKTDTRLPLSYLGQAPGVIYTAGRPDDVRRQHAYQKTVVPTGLANPVLGLQSETADEKATVLARTMTSTINDILTDRQPFEAYAAAVQSWLQAGGQQMKDEYEEQLQQQG